MRRTRVGTVARASIMDLRLQSSRRPIEQTECDREPVHIPGAIQPFGVLVAFSLPTWEVSHVSLNAPALFGAASAEDMIGGAMETVLPPTIIHDLRNTFQAAMISGFAERLAGQPIGIKAEVHDILIHASGQIAVAEFIPLAGADTIRTDPATLVKTIIERLRRTTSLKAFLVSAARQIRAVTGYDRVMIYKFLEDESGEVVAEALRAGMPPFLGLHYPASDIPAQSRALFLRQWLRMIPQVEDVPIPVTPTLTKKGTPLDLSLSTLRASSPIHLQYLRNMGSAATLTVSIVDGDRLWGMIACHHDTPRRISSSMAAAVELFAQVFSGLIESKMQKDELAYHAQAREVLDALVTSMEPEETIFQNLRGFAEPLKAMIPCDGIGVWTEGHFESDGVVPPDDAIEELIRFLDLKRVDRCFSTDRLSKMLPDAMRYIDKASGLIAVPFSRSPKDYVLLFRREVVQTVNWGGDPRKAIKKDGGGLSPRESFAAWREQVEAQSLPWRPAELEMAETLRIALLDVILRRANLVDRERRVAQESQLLLVAELNHRVKNVLAVIRSLVRQSQQVATSFESFTADLQSRIHALAKAHDLLTQAHWKQAPLRGLVEVEAEAWTETNDPRLVLEGPPVMVEARAYQSLALVLHELMTNAAKYGALSVKDGRLTVAWALEKTGDLILTWTESNGPEVSPPTRRGFGTIVIEQSIPFEVQGEAAIAYPPEGVRARFKIPYDFIERADADVARVQAAPAQRADLNGKSLLLVEDSMMIALDAQAMLQRCGAEVELVATTNDARRAIELNTFDAAILDVNLYTETSYRIAEELQDRAIPFVFATGYGEQIIVPERFKHVHVISKPYAEDALRAALAA